MANDKSIIPADIVTVNGTSVLPEELIGEEIVGQMKLDNTFASDDPMFADYQRYLAEVNNASIVNPDDVYSGTGSEFFDGIDLESAPTLANSKYANLGEDHYYGLEAWAKASLFAQIIFGSHSVSQVDDMASYSKKSLSGESTTFYDFGYEYEPIQVAERMVR